MARLAHLAIGVATILGCAHPAAPPPPAPARAPLELRPGGTLASALARARPGDRIVVRAGEYPAEQIEAALPDVSDAPLPGAVVTVEAAPGEQVTFAGATFTRSSHIALRRLRFAGTLKLAGCSHMELSELELDAGDSKDAALYLLGRQPFGPTHHVRVTGSRIAGGGRTVFIHTYFGPSEGWNHDLEFTGNRMACGARNCFQLSGARDTVIADNTVESARGGGILMAGATRVQVLRNRMDNGRGSAVQVGTPGAEWDRFGGVEHMISSQILIADNVIRSWGGAAVQLDGCRDVEIRRNTVEHGPGLVTHRREPHDLQGNVILVGNSGVRLQGNRLPEIRVAEGDPAPQVEP